MDNSIVISTPPHVKCKRTTRGIMLDVIIALLPCAICGIIYFGLDAFIVEMTAMAACVATEFIYFFIQNKGFSRDIKKVCVRWAKQFDFTSIVTGLILALILPSTVKFYEVIIGSVFAIAIVKMLFGGTGKNLVNPAAAARVFMALSFAATMVKYNFPNFDNIDTGYLTGSATNLTQLLGKDPATRLTAVDLFLGTGVKGCIGETCKLAIIVGCIYLIARKVIKWWQPVLFMGVFGFAAVLFSGFGFEDGFKYDMTLFLPHIFSGGVLFAAVYMFPDYVTSPKYRWGQFVYIIISALLMAALRYLTGMEVASYVIMLMNLFVPLIDKYIRPRPFGFKKEKKAKEEKVNG